eukprot:CAMPEP_0184648872 /NCGR_PEP_ID=MMETSP0308-20130426/6115_1 /TAXON_ID=38269 /ORGANISM="Gloeochaete witrockiana, Strain SAG 46.84" /LENGTH=187 /DNA_ID=CAMNT_0027081135 /DNA_START=292 /DNA_END=858 /DNA_ORIENTATION=+
MDDEIIAVVRNLSVTIDSLRPKRPRNEYCSDSEADDDELRRAWKRGPVRADLPYERSKNPLASELLYLCDDEDQDQQTTFVGRDIDPDQDCEIRGIFVIASQTIDAQDADLLACGSQDAVGCSQESFLSDALLPENSVCEDSLDSIDAKPSLQNSFAASPSFPSFANSSFSSVFTSESLQQFVDHYQ